MMDVKVSKDKNISRWFAERTSSILDETEQKTVHNNEEDNRYRKKK